MNPELDNMKIDKNLETDIPFERKLINLLEEFRKNYGRIPYDELISKLENTVELFSEGMKNTYESLQSQKKNGQSVLDELRDSFADMNSKDHTKTPEWEKRLSKLKKK